MKKRELRDVAAQHHNANGEWRRQDETGGPPQNSPKDSRHQQRQRRDPRVRAVKPRLDEVANDQFEASKQQEHQQGRQPAVKSRQSKCDGQQGGNHRAYIRHNTQERGDDSPERRIGHSNEVQSESEQNSKSGVDQNLHQQVSAHTLRRIVERLRQHVDLPDPNQPEKTMTQIESLDQHEDRENEDQSYQRQR